ncbi:hypothetical protein N8I77_010970 [Diaporthe amygdali]|uniref:Uncharacterized protein n=1 Tax=Phomopsis amygdali TaxID=1214568 RepID=A0AAD9W0K0_PHOAM|nr:hypothetical protein N8I77_010970 [Diaporthe amygdali]
MEHSSARTAASPVYHLVEARRRWPIQMSGGRSSGYDRARWRERIALTRLMAMKRDLDVETLRGAGVWTAEARANAVKNGTVGQDFDSWRAYDRISMEISEVSRIRRSRRVTVYAGGDIQMDDLWKKHQLLVTYSHADMLVKAESIEPRW